MVAGSGDMARRGAPPLLGPAAPGRAGGLVGARRPAPADRQAPAGDKTTRRRPRAAAAGGTTGMTAVGPRSLVAAAATEDRPPTLVVSPFRAFGAGRH